MRQEVETVAILGKSPLIHLTVAQGLETFLDTPLPPGISVVVVVVVGLWSCKAFAIGIEHIFVAEVASIPQVASILDKVGAGVAVAHRDLL